MRPEFLDARVSVIIPTRNNMDTLPATLSSVGLQQMSGVEIIIIDDGSTDGTREWLAEMARETPAMRVLHTDSLGPSGARNEGIAIASAPIIAFVDSDDTWSRGKLRFQVEYMERNPHIGFTFTDYRHVSPTGEDRGTCFEYWQSPFRRQPPTHFFELENAESLLLGCNLVGTSTVAVRKELLQNANGFAMELTSAEDWDLWLRLAHLAPVAATSMVSTLYLMRPGSVTSRSADRIAAMESIVSRYAERPEPHIRDAMRKVRARLHRARAEMRRAESAYTAAATSEIRALFADPDRQKLKAVAGDVMRSLKAARGAMLPTSP